MFNCHEEMIGFHNDEVTLPQKERTEMKERRDANRKRLKNGLKKNADPMPKEFKSQGSYAMKTMTQDQNKDYDIDDGVYFVKEDLVGPKGGDLTPLDARKMVRDALDDGGFKTPPEVKTNCVRAHYNAGYHVDIPVYRWIEDDDPDESYAELASSEWKRSDARDVTSWFDQENKNQSPDDSNGRQLRRLTRYSKKFGRSRESWKGRMLSGFGITKLVTECYVSNEDREDKSVRRTLEAIRDRLNWSLVIDHPVTSGETITQGDDDATAKFLRDRLDEKLEILEALDDKDCTRAEALAAWDKYFNTTYFSDQLEKAESKKSKTKTSPAAADIAAGLTAAIVADSADSQEIPSQPVNKRGGGRYA